MRSFASTASLVAFALLALAHGALASGNLDDLKDATRKGQWDNACEIARDMLATNPANAEARVEAAYALFQKGYSNAALLMLKPMTAADWKKIPQGQDRFAEIVLFFQKKVPLAALPGRLEQLRTDDSGTGGLRDEVLLAQGRTAYEKGDFPTAETKLVGVSAASRYFAQAHYILGAIAVKNHHYDRAVQEFNRVFEPALFEKSTEFWKDMAAQSTSHWGTNLTISLDAESVSETTKVGELSLLALGRIAYGRKDYESAVRYYDRMAETSAFRPRATLEKVWTLLQENHHDEAEKTAQSLSVSEKAFEAFEAGPLRALVLTDSGQVGRAREELDRFAERQELARKQIGEFEGSRLEAQLPEFLRNDLEQDVQLRTLRRYLTGLQQEVEALRKEDTRLFPLYARMAVDVEALTVEARESIANRVAAHVSARKADLDRLFLQSRLIRAETYLEEREQLRAQLKAKPTSDPAEQNRNDQKLMKLLDSAVAEVEAAKLLKSGNLRLDLRQSELLWELGIAHGIIAQSNQDKKEDVVALSFKKRALALAQEISERHREFSGHSDALFFTGYMLYDQAEFEPAYRVLESYVKAYPRHEHVPDAYRILADARFDADDFAAAERLYQKVLEFPDSPVVGYALYKLGWCAYNRRDFGRALLGLEKAVLWTLSSTSAQLSLKRESRHDLIGIYAEVGEAKKAWDYFGRFFQDDPNGWISELAKELDRIGQYEKSAELYRGLIARHPGEAGNLVFQSSLLRGAFQLRRWDDVLSTGQALVDKYAAAVREPGAPGTDSAIAESTFRDALLGNLFEARKAPSDEATARTIKLNTLYLTAFERWPSAQEPLYRHAQFLFDHGQVDPAVAAFKKHWASFGATLKEPLREESLRSVIHALEAREAKVEKAGAELSPSATDILAYADEYATAYPKTQYLRAIRFLKSAVLFKYGKIDDGLALAQKLFDDNPSDDVGKRSFQNLRVAYYERKDWEGTFKWSQALLKKATPAMEPYRADLKAIREESLFLWADATRDDSKAAELYLQLADNPDMKRLSTRALFNAFVRLQKISRTEALKVAERLQKQDPEFEPLIAAAGVRAAFYQEAGDYVRSAPLLEQFLKAPPKDATPQQLGQARLNLALIQEATGDLQGAQANYKLIEAMAPEAKRGLERIARGKSGGSLPPSARWSAIRAGEEKFDKQPLPRFGELQSKIKRGGESLENLSKEILSFAGDSKANPDEAMEAYCSLPFLYERYGQAVLALPKDKAFKKDESAELTKALEPIVAPIRAKAKDLGVQCVKKSAEIEHDGAKFREANRLWGWEADAAQVAEAEELMKLLAGKAPWLDPTTTKLTEDEIVRRHHAAAGAPSGTPVGEAIAHENDTWYELAMLRWKAGKTGLARLTLIDALNKSSPSVQGAVLNALAVLDQKAGIPALSLTPLYEKATAAGSKAAWANLALLHLQGRRLASAKAVLHRGLVAKAFEAMPELQAKLLELFPEEKPEEKAKK